MYLTYEILLLLKRICYDPSVRIDDLSAQTVRFKDDNYLGMQCVCALYVKTNNAIRTY